MLNVLVKKSTEEMQVHVQLSDGRMMYLKDLVMDYERLLKEESLKKAITSGLNDGKSITSKLNVGEWFRIDREVIEKNAKEICRKCNDAGRVGKKLWKRFKKSNEIADDDLNQYPRLIETYIFEHIWEYKTEQEMRDMCEWLGDGMCDEVICDLELQMRICNGESVNDLTKKANKFPRIRVIKLRGGGTGYLGGDTYPRLYREAFLPDHKIYKYVPYAFRRVLSQH